MKKPSGYWTKEKCQEEALKYNTRKDLKKFCSSAYNVIYNNDWLNEICSHMIELRKSNGYWTKEKCQEVALLCETRTEYEVLYGSSHYTACKNGWVEEICSHMKKLKIPSKYWEKEKCLEVALLCKSRKEFNTKYSAAFDSSSKNGWLNEICSHMKPENSNPRCVYAYEFSDNYVYIG